MAKTPKLQTDQPSYEEAFAELKAISEAIENEAISVDALAESVRRASELIQFCQTRLRSTESDLEQILRQLNTPDSQG
jgi:exodeoxyribonuclease VII small subunit